MKLDMIKDLFNAQDIYVFTVIGLTLLTLYVASVRSIRHSRMANDQKRRFIGNLRGFFIFILLGSVFVIWADELYQFIISIAALMAGFAIAGKEVFLCFGGSFYKAFARPFSVGNRIEIDGIRGDVVDVGLMSTQLLEIGPKDYTQQLTGRMITIPNSLFLTSEVFNETDSITEHQDFVLHVIKVPIKVDSHWETHRNSLLECANSYCEKYSQPAIEFFQRLSKKRHVDMPLLEPRINIKFDGPEQIFFILRICVPVDQKGFIEQDILKSYLNQNYS
jgi:small-conductance mechanosensitive channel